MLTSPMGGISVVCDTKVHILRQVRTKATGIGELNEVRAAKRTPRA